MAGDDMAGAGVDYKTCPSLPAMFFAEAARRGDRPFLWAKRAGAYSATSWREAARQASALSRGLRALGIRRGDRVALIAENRPEWLIADFAIMAAGAVTVPAYTTNTIEDHRHILANSGVRAVIVSTAALTQRVMPAADQITDIANIITIEKLAVEQVGHAEIHLWGDVLARGAALQDDVAEMVAKATRDDT